MALYTVTTNADSGAGSLRQAIIDANATADNDEIIFSSSIFLNGPSTITLGAAFPDIDAVADAGSLTITGTGASSLTIDANGGIYRIFVINTGGNLNISGVTVTGANSSNIGGAFANNRGSLTITNSTISGNAARMGAGISNYGTLTVSNSTLSNNSAVNAAGIYNDGIATVTNSTIKNNTVTEQGGGVINFMNGTLTLTNSTISDNTARWGGGITNIATLTVTNSTISGNTASDTGGGIANYGSLTTITNSTISGNSASGAGGGIANFGPINIANTIIANSVSWGVSGGDFFGAQPVSSTKNIVEDGSITQGAIKADPLLGPLQDNVGPTVTMALGVGSPAIGAGDATISNASPVNSLDQRGVSRSSTAPSIGAYEGTAAPTPILGSTPLPAASFSPAFPHVISIATGSGNVTNSASFTVTFNQPIIGLDPTDFNIVTTGSVANGTLSSITGSGDTYTVNVTGITGTGTIGLNLIGLPSITALPSFAAQATFATGNAPVSVRLGDVDSDGILDIITAYGTSDNISVMLGNGNGTFKTEAIIAMGTGSNPTSVTLGDVDRDGFLDIITANGGTSNASVLLGIGDGTFGTAVNYTTGNSPSSVTLGDVNRDGILDIITADEGSDTVSVLFGIGNGAFPTVVNYGTGNSPSSVTLGDLNRDGILDIITANEDDDNVSVLLGNGNGTFATAVNHSTNDAPSSVTLGDVNSDGVLDIITANRNSDTASVLLGNGIAPGDFGPGADLATGDAPSSATLGDVNGDGRLDLITANENSTNASVLLGNGDGTFAAQATFATGDAPKSVTLGDVNGDGRLDIISANNISSTTSVLLGTGGSAITATFTTQPSLATGNAPRSVTKGDVNGDGFLDIITANEDGDNVSVLLGNGNGSFKTQATFATDKAPRSVTLGDVNGDGKLDIITANYDNDNISVLLGNGNGTFGLNKTFGAGNAPYSVTLGDVNGDSKLDIITANFYSDDVSVLLGNGDGIFKTQVPFGTGSNSYPTSVTLGDVNGDGKLDIITANYDSDNVSVLLNTTVSGSTTPTFAAQASPTAGSGSEPYSVTLGDVNGDGKLDIITANKNNDTASVLLGNGNGTFQTQVPYATGDSPRSVTLGDVNGDGKLDIITANGISNNASVLLGNGNGNGTFATAVNYATGDRPKSVTLDDVNGDGTLDIITANEQDDNLSVLLGNGDGTFQIPPLATGTEPYSVTLGDVNGDGRLDIITANYDSDNVSVLLGNGNGTFLGQLTFVTGNAPSSVTVGDVNRDGKLDIITANELSDNASVLLGIGDGTFGAKTDFATGDRPFSVPLGDVNGDGILDIITANRDSNSASVLLGNGDGTFQNQATFGTGTKPHSVTLGDVNGDGRLDIITANRDSDNASVLLGNGDGTFGVKTDFATGDRPLFVILGDVNGDAILDIITANSNSNDASVLLGNGNGTFAAKTDFGTGTKPYSVTLSDVNGDGIFDIITANYGSDDASVLLGNGNGTFQGQQTFGTGTGTSPASVTLGDVNGDGRLDIITANYGSNNASVLLNILAFSGQTANVVADTTAPTLSSSSPADDATAVAVASNLVLTFSETVVAGTGNITLKKQSDDSIVTAIAITDSTQISISGSTVTINPTTDLAYSTNYYVEIDASTIKDLANNNYAGINSTTALNFVTATLSSTPLPAAPFSPAFPHVLSITTGSGSITNSAAFTVTFNQPIIGLDAADFNIVTTGTVSGGTIASITGSGATYTVNVTGITGTGTLGLSLVGLPTINALPSFAAQATLATGNGASSVTMGDVNGDGRLDIITANFSDNNASVLLGNGNGTFQTQATFATGSKPRTVTLGDVNGDGKLDIITANRDSNNISILLGNGNGTFQSQATFATGTSPRTVTLGDVNGDGRLDIITANRNSDDTSVLLGNGDGTFQTQQIFAAGLGPQSGTLEDVNGDGKLDIITANFSDNNASVLLGNGNGTFQTQATFATGTNPRYVTMGDVNADGKLDIVIANSGSANSSVLLGNGNGTFQTQATFAIGNRPSSVTLGDVNGDGKLDIITSNDDSDDSSVLLGNGNGTFQTKVDFAVGDGALSVTLGDVNGDGRLDIIAANYNSNNASVILGTGGSAGSTTFTPQETFATGNVPESVAMGDVNGDGILDMITANSFSSSASVLLGNGNGTFGPKTDFATGIAPASVTLGDVDGDGTLDIITSNFNFPGNVSVLLGNGNGTFQGQQTFATGATPKSMALGDVNGDGRLDIITSNYFFSNASVLLGNGNGTFQAKTDFATGNRPRSVALGDLNGDGTLDIITANQGTNHVSVLLGNGNGTFGLNTDFDAGANQQSLTLGDVNSDGKLDIITANSADTTVSVLLGNGNGSFQGQQTFATGGSQPNSVTLSDVNGDGRLDIITANLSSNDVSILLGNGNGSFQGQQTFSVGTQPSSVALADLNRDGRPDIITANSGYVFNNLGIPEYVNNVSVLLNSLAFTGQTSNVGVPSDTTAPTLSSSSPADDATAVAVASNLVLTFSETVVAGTGNITLKKQSDNSIVTAIAISDSTQISISGSTVTINPTTDLAYSTNYYVEIDASTIKDLANNNYAGINSPTILNFSTAAAPDTIAPTLAISASKSTLKATETATITFTFSEDPGNSFSWDGTTGDVAVTGGTLSAISGSALTRTATFTPTPNTNAGTASITVSAGSYSDAAGNNGGAGTTPALTFDTQAPSIAITSNASTLKSGEIATLTFTFSEDPGNSFSWDGTTGDLSVTGGTLSAISGSGLTRNAIFTPSANTNAGTASITVSAGSYSDAAGNNGGAGTTPSLTFDTQAPSLAITSNVSTLKSDETATITFTFSEDPSTSFTSDDVSGTGGTLSAISGSGLTRTAIFTPTPNSTATASISIASGTVSDGADNLNTDGSDTNNSLSITVDTVLTSGPINITSDTDTGEDDTITSVGLPVVTFTGESNLVLRLIGADSSTPLNQGTQYAVSFTNGTYTVSFLDAAPQTTGLQPFGTYSNNTPTGNGTIISDGTYTINATDAAGNSGTVGSILIATDGLDNDGANDTFELNYDINNDGIKDSKQRFVATFESSTIAQGATNGNPASITVKPIEQANAVDPLTGGNLNAITSLIFRGLADTAETTTGDSITGLQTYILNNPGNDNLPAGAELVVAVTDQPRFRVIPEIVRTGTVDPATETAFRAAVNKRFKETIQQVDLYFGNETAAWNVLFKPDGNGVYYFFGYNPTTGLGGILLDRDNNGSIDGARLYLKDNELGDLNPDDYVIDDPVGMAALASAPALRLSDDKLGLVVDGVARTGLWLSIAALSAAASWQNGLELRTTAGEFLGSIGATANSGNLGSKQIYLEAGKELRFAQNSGNNGLNTNPLMILSADGAGFRLRLDDAGGPDRDYNDLELSITSSLVATKIDEIAMARRQSTSADAIIDLTTIPTSGAKLTLSILTDCGYINRLGLIKVEDSLTGYQVAGVAAANTEAFRQAVRDNLINPGGSAISAGGQSSRTITWDVTTADAGLYAAVLINPNGQVFTFGSSTGSDGRQHVKVLGDNTFGFEDLLASQGSDWDFNDLKVKVSFV